MGESSSPAYFFGIVILFDTVDLIVLVRFLFSRISRGGQICEFKNLAKIIFYNSATKEKWLFVNSNLREQSQNQKFAKI